VPEPSGAELFFQGELPGKLATLLGLLVVSRVGVYIPLPGVDRAAFEAAVGNNGLLAYVDNLAGGGISKLGVFSLGIIPYINSSIVFQLLASFSPDLKKLQREEGEAGRRQFNQYMRYGALAFASVQAVGQVLYVRPFVYDFDLAYLAGSSLTLVAGAMILMYIGEQISELKLGNGTSLLIFTNILSSLPASIGATIASGGEGTSPESLALFFTAFLGVTLGIVAVQEAERRVPINYASRYQARARGLDSSSFLPFKVNTSGVMPIIFSSSMLALPSTLARFTGSEALATLGKSLFPGGAYYVPINVGLIVFFNYFYTFLQLDPKDVSEQLKRGGASIPGVRPGKQTANFLSDMLGNLSVLGSVFLGVLAVAPTAVEQATNLTAFRGFAGTSVLILVGVATDTARRVKAELQMERLAVKSDQFDLE
jgi:preprotein translocase SecY subunit